MNIFEDTIKKYFGSVGISIDRIPEGKNKTPDFEGKEILVEVKAIRPQELEGVQKDSTYNAIKNNLQDAARKFREYDPKNKKNHIVVIFSEDIIANDIFSVWTGEFAPDIPHRIFPSGMLLSKNHRKYIDAIVWFKKLSDTAPKHIWATSNKIRKYFSKVKIQF